MRKEQILSWAPRNVALSTRFSGRRSSLGQPSDRKAIRLGAIRLPSLDLSGRKQPDLDSYRWPALECGSEGLLAPSSQGISRRRCSRFLSSSRDSSSVSSSLRSRKTREGASVIISAVIKSVVRPADTSTSEFPPCRRSRVMTRV